MILDTGIKCSYISQKVQCHLNLIIIRTEEISIDRLGEQATEFKKVRLRCRLRSTYLQNQQQINNSYKIRCYTTSQQIKGT